MERVDIAKSVKYLLVKVVAIYNSEIMDIYPVRNFSCSANEIINHIYNVGHLLCRQNLCQTVRPTLCTKLTYILIYTLKSNLFTIEASHNVSLDKSAII